QPIISVVRIQLNALKHSIVDVQPGVCPDSELIKSGERHPALEVGQPEGKRGALIRSIGAIAIGPGAESGEGVGDDVIIDNVHSHLEIPADLFEEEKAVVSVVL